jgi:HD superfamily phosphodiesterase
MENIISRVKQELAHAESGHDFNHIERVLNLANKIAADE